MRYVLAMVLCLQLGYFSVAWPSETCRAAVASHLASDPTLFTDLKAYLGQLSASSIYSGTRPDWTHYNQVQQLILRTEKVKLSPQEKQELRVLLSEESQLLQTLSESLYKKQAEQKTEFINTTKRFIDDNIAYFRLLNKLNTLLGVKIVPLPILKDLTSDRKLVIEAENLLRRLEAEVETKFTNISKLGFKDLTEFENFARTESPRSAQLIELTKNNLIVSMHRPESARFWIPVAGFQNQRITKSSNGSLYTDSSSVASASGRDKAEANLTMSTLEEYIPQSARFKPNYAEARLHHRQNDFLPYYGADGYGTDLWIIKDEVIQKRATWTPKDSLSPGWRENLKMGLDDVFIPWKFRSLIVPYLNREQYFTPSSINPNFRMNLSRWASGTSYIEVQIFGPLGINDVKAFHFKRTPPNKAFYEYLHSKNIEVFDERSWPPKPYKGEESL